MPQSRDFSLCCRHLKGGPSVYEPRQSETTDLQSQNHPCCRTHPRYEDNSADLVHKGVLVAGEFSTTKRPDSTATLSPAVSKPLFPFETRDREQRIQPGGTKASQDTYNTECRAASTYLANFRLGDRVVFQTENGQDHLAEITKVQGSGAYYEPSNDRVTASLGIGRYSCDISAHTVAVEFVGHDGHTTARRAVSLMTPGWKEGDGG